LKSGLLVFWLVSAPVLALLYMMVPTSPDQALYDYIAWMQLHGAPYYKGVVDMNWPGVMLIHELGIRLFGVHFWTFHLIDFLIMQIGTVAIFLFLRCAGFLLAPFIVLAIYPIIYTTAGEWMAGERDIIGAEFLIFASVLLISTFNGLAGVVKSALAGSLIAFAVLIRPTYASFIFGVLLLDILGSLNLKTLRLSRIEHIWSVLGGFIALIGAMLIAGWLIGNLGDWYDQTILFSLQSYPFRMTKLELLFQCIYLLSNSWHWMTLFAGLGLLTWLYRRGLRIEPIIIVGIGLTIILSYFVQGKGFAYHLGGLIPLLILLTAVSIDALMSIFIEATSTQRRWACGIVALFVIVVTIFGTLKKFTALSPQLQTLAGGEFKPIRAVDLVDNLNAEETQTLVGLIQAGSTPDEYFLQWGRNFTIGYLSQRRSNTLFFNTSVFETLSDRFDKEHHWLAKFSHDLIAKPPVFILVKRSSLDNLEAPLVSPTGAPAAFQLLIERINSNYRIALVSEKIVLFKQK
jgi:hypothetical protein